MPNDDLPDAPCRFPGRLVAGLLLIVVGGTVALLGWKALVVWTSPPLGRSPCASNLRQIGQAAQLYANEHDGRFPDDIEGLLTQDIIPSVFVCPDSGDTAAAQGPTTQATAANVNAPGHCSYVYVGKGWRVKDATADVVMAYEPLKNHEGRGMNVVYGDGHVDWVAAAEARAMLSELAAGHNPPRSEAERSAATAPAPATSPSAR